MIGIVDYGAGNLHSVQKAFAFLEKNSTILEHPSELDNIERLVLPGVGSFGHAMREIEMRTWLAPLKEWLADERPFLGICLGMQLLFESSDESPGQAGFSIMDGNCRKFAVNKVPQIGWNDIRITNMSSLFDGIESGDFFYFVHSYHVVPENCDVVYAGTSYGCEYPSVVGRGRVLGVQFHPEKSGDKGLQLLKNWVERC
jgi:imidazole glycerol phosphate synthase glutamine amidotransferase subunit